MANSTKSKFDVFTLREGSKEKFARKNKILGAHFVFGNKPGTYSLEYEYPENRPKTPLRGKLGNRVQGDHTFAYSAVLKAFAWSLNNVSINELWPILVRFRAYLRLIFISHQINNDQCRGIYEYKEMAELFLEDLYWTKDETVA